MSRWRARRVGLLGLAAACAAGACGAFTGDDPSTPADPATPAASSSTGADAAGAPADAAPDGASARPLEAGAGDAGASACPLATCRYVFVSTSTHPGTTLDKPEAMDQACAVLAAKNPAFDGRTFRPWLSYVNRSAGSLLGPAPKEYRLVDGSLVATDNVDLLSGRVRHAIDRDETGGAASGTGRVWTGTSNTGTSGQNCLDWRDSALSAVVGDSTSGDAWSSVATEPCSLERPIYCIQTSP